MPVIIRSRRRTIALIVENDGSLTVRAPYHLSRSLIDRFIEEHADWIREKQNIAKLHTPQPHRFVDGEIFYFLGQEYTLNIVSDQSPPLRFDNGFYLHRNAVSNAIALFTNWYILQAQFVIGDRLTHFSSKLCINYSVFRISKARRRLGSCSNRGSLNFAWRLAMAPIDVIDYIVVHELTHILFPNHSKEFWKKVNQFMPDYSIHKKWLKENGNRLIL